MRNEERGRHMAHTIIEPRQACNCHITPAFPEKLESDRSSMAHRHFVIHAKVTKGDPSNANLIIQDLTELRRIDG